MAGIILLALVACVPVETEAERLPIIDVHVHSVPELGSTKEVLRNRMRANGVALTLVSINQRSHLDDWTSEDKREFLVGPSFPCTDGIYPTRTPCFPDSGGWPDLAWLREQISAGNVSMLGELNYVYYGIPPTDPRLAPYFDLAEEFDIPVGVHADLGPKNRADRHAPDFDGALADPALLEPILASRPSLRLFLMHVGRPELLPQTISLLRRFPNVYGEMSVFNSILGEEDEAHALRTLIAAGVGHKIMLGSDNEPVGAIVDRLKRFEFLSEAQRRAILYDNAARFLRLDEETIRRHHAQ